jgi:hypothetical protein
MHPLRKLREAGSITLAKIKLLLAEDVVFHSPIFVMPVEGREKVAAMFALSLGVRRGSYVAEYRLDDRTTLLVWKGKIQGREIESFEMLTDDLHGLLIERTVAYRPFPAIQIFRNEMYRELKGILGPEYWDYPAEDQSQQ